MQVDIMQTVHKTYYVENSYWLTKSLKGMRLIVRVKLLTVLKSTSLGSKFHKG